MKQKPILQVFQAAAPLALVTIDSLGSFTKTMTGSQHIGYYVQPVFRAHPSYYNFENRLDKSWDYIPW